MSNEAFERLKQECMQTDAETLHYIVSLALEKRRQTYIEELKKFAFNVNLSQNFAINHYFKQNNNHKINTNILHNLQSQIHKLNNELKQEGINS